MQNETYLSRKLFCLSPMKLCRRQTTSVGGERSVFYGDGILLAVDETSFFKNEILFVTNESSFVPHEIFYAKPLFRAAVFIPGRPILLFTARYSWQKRQPIRLA
jgi:hypothetical protein